ncbi:MAG: DUF2490 domain-containing protein [Ferruginibacter sp.]
MALIFMTFAAPSFSQEQRLTDNNAIGWFVYTGTFRIKPKVATHTEYQWRRVYGIKKPQQGLFRTGINYALRKDISLNAGYAFAETFPYGDYPVATAFPEHRIYEQLALNNQADIVALSHRFTIEQRFVGKILNQNNNKTIHWVYMNRMRYRVRAEMPITKKKDGKNIWGVALMDEVFIGWGKNIGANVFDQNRLSILLNYKVNQNIKIEAGYLNQILQQGKRVNDKSVFQYNNGFLLATHLSLSLIK